MNRAEKRRLNRQNKVIPDCSLWFDKLPIDKKIYVEELIYKHTVENDNLIISILDKCFTSSLDDILEIDKGLIKKIISESTVYVADYKEYLENKGNEGYIMVKNVELREKAKEKIIEYMHGKIQKGKALKLLKNEFDLPFAELGELWIDCKDIFVKKSDKSKLDSKEIALDAESEVIDKVVKIEPSTRLKVVNISKEISGLFGTYIKTYNGVTVGDKHYFDVEEVNDEEKDIRSKYETKMSDIEKQIAELNMALDNIRDEGKKELEGFSELREVFEL